jgi:hypothetical protein
MVAAIFLTLVSSERKGKIYRNHLLLAVPLVGCRYLTALTGATKEKKIE